MNILVTHCWVRGNLGDWVLTYQLLTAIRTHASRIHLVGTPGFDAGDVGGRVRELADIVSEHPHSADLTETFREYDAVLVAPGGGLQVAGDGRGRHILRDIDYCGRHDIPCAVTGTSVHESFAAQMRGYPRQLIIAREPETHETLAAHGVPSVLGADLAFLHSYPPPAPAPGPALVFLRYDHYRDVAVRRAGWFRRANRLVGRASGGPLSVELPDSFAFCTSDPGRDDRLLGPLARRCGAPYVRCRGIDELLAAIAGASAVISDRYHPIIFAHMIGVPYTQLRKRGNPRDDGLARLLAAHSKEELRAMANKGTDALVEFLRQVHESPRPVSAAGL